MQRYVLQEHKTPGQQERESKAIVGGSNYTVIQLGNNLQRWQRELKVGLKDGFPGSWLYLRQTCITCYKKKKKTDGQYCQGMQSVNEEHV